MRPEANEFNIADNNVLEYECNHIACGQIDANEDNYDVFVFASPFYFCYMNMVKGNIPFDIRLYQCRHWVWKFQIHNS
jgi:hypothetical protein